MLDRDAVASENSGLACWFTCLDEQLESIKLFAEHGLYSWRHLLETAWHESTNAVRNVKAGVIGATT